MRNCLSILLIAYNIQTCVTHRFKFVKNHCTVSVFLSSMKRRSERTFRKGIRHFRDSFPNSRSQVRRKV